MGSRQEGANCPAKVLLRHPDKVNAITAPFCLRDPRPLLDSTCFLVHL